MERCELCRVLGWGAPCRHVVVASGRLPPRPGDVDDVPLEELEAAAAILDRETSE
jgi:hypothetical protein